MNDWQDLCWKQLEKTAADMEKFFAEVGEAGESVVEEVSENLESFLNDIQLDFEGEVNNFFENFIDVIITTSDEIDAALNQDWESFVDEDFTSVSYHSPSATSHPACINCANYHGQVYNGNLLVCGMHPHGWEDNCCPDWDQK